jgi:hypothetical protein
MFYVKNLPTWERILRVIIGMASLVIAYLSWGHSNFGLASAAIGAMLSMTGLMGFCPMCAMVGRRLKQEQ